jgi:hypothetical protein
MADCTVRRRAKVLGLDGFACSEIVNTSATRKFVERVKKLE